MTHAIDRELAKKTPVDNAPGAHEAKLELRRNVLAEMRAHREPTRVLDLYAGLGEMYLGAWHEADEYAGCDARKWSATEPHRRYVVDNLVLLRALDLAPYNVFDFDAYGQPWPQALIFAARRRGRTGERGAIVMTDGGAYSNSWGMRSDAQRHLLGGEIEMRGSSGHEASAQVQRACFAALIERMGVRLERLWHLEAKAKHSGRKGSVAMHYSAATFVGL